MRLRSSPVFESLSKTNHSEAEADHLPFVESKVLRAYLTHLARNDLVDCARVDTRVLAFT
jgi:hypothetical protein